MTLVEQITIGIAAIALIVAVVGIFISGYANRISKRAMEMAAFSHRKEVAPSIVATFFESQYINQFIDPIILFTNENYGRATVQRLYGRGGVELVDMQYREIGYPFELPLNNTRKFRVQIVEAQFIATFNKPSRQATSAERAEYMKGIWFEADYSDELNNNYSIALLYDSSIGKYKGKPAEASTKFFAKA